MTNKKQNEKQIIYDEPLLSQKNERLVLFPIENIDIWNYYKNAIANFWTPEEINLSDDVKDWDIKLNDNEKHFISHVLAFFAASDGIVVNNLAEDFLDKVKIIEAKFFYGFQIAMENVHSHTYSLLIDAYIKDKKEQDFLFNAVENIPSVKRKAKWATRWIDEGTFIERLIAFAVVEGIFFSGSFCSIFWLKNRGIMPGLSFANELISRDEGMHRDFACHLYKNYIKNKLDEDKVIGMIKDAVSIEKEFVSSSLPVSLVGMNADMMCEYIEFVADHLIVELGLEKIYNSECPFDFMNTISLSAKTNFFERRVSEYQKSGVLSGDNSGGFSLNEEF